MTHHTARHPELDPQLRAVLEALDSLGGKPMYEGTVEEARALSRMPVDMRDPASLPGLAAVEDITVAGAAGQLRARVHRPSADGARPTVVFFHGGGFVVGDLDTIEPAARDAALACDAVVVTVDYRLAPEHPTPAAALDAVAATRWIADHLPTSAAATCWASPATRPAASFRRSSPRRSATRAGHLPGNCSSTPQSTSRTRTPTRR